MKNQTDDLDKKARQIFQDRIQRGMIGPGSDMWGLPDEEEIISDYPLPRYFSGVLFPNKSETPATQSGEDDAALESESLFNGNDEEEDPSDEENKDVEGTKDTGEKQEKIKVARQDFNLDTNSFFPTNIGITIAVDKSVKDIEVEFSFGLYTQAKTEERKIKISKAGYDSFFEEGIPYPLPFRDVLKYEDGYMFLNRELKGEQKNPERAKGEYGEFDEFKNRRNLIRQTEEGGYFSAFYHVGKLEKLLGRAWKRTPYIFTESISVEKSFKTPVSFDFPDKIYKLTGAGYNIKVYEDARARFVKIQLVNQSEDHPANRFSNRSENLNFKSLFQGSIKVQTNGLIEYKDNSLNTYAEDDEIRDSEAEEIELIYRNIKSYGIGHNCSVIWDVKRKTVQSTFLPEQNINDVINEFEDSSLDKALDMRNLSIWGLSKDEIKVNLKDFVLSYDAWINKQVQEKNSLNNTEKEVADRVIKRQQQNYNRLNENINLLDDAKVFKAFQLANTAMLIQLIISNDKNLGKTEKDLFEIDKSINANRLEYFEHYDTLKNLGFVPKYRPFQLAFLLLSLDEIAFPEKRKANNTVDLIWFPTGGGKTEAYLAVAAFTIAFRRISNETNYGGTSVIMRYTLRLLTAQQFERASRLIATLEFMRCQPEFADALKVEPISIGLWVGQASTPNKIGGDNGASVFVSQMDEEALKGEKGNPERKNVFQISSCPWCGTKSVSKEKNSKGETIWRYGFKVNRGELKVSCINKQCHFHKGLPIQVVDENLYENPPTLLFGTVDKFAMLAWQDEAHNFFKANTVNGLPPDLIIQDELHLLNGPLGSITALFESTIELLCTKNGIAPKIISSTATTRNTQYQIEKLYGNRKVNIFPPSGINHNDSFFSRESTESKRRYIGFMATGKTSIDTQLQLLAHLFVSRLEVYRNKETTEFANNYWTIVSYYNSLKDVGKIFNKVGDEVTNFTSTLQYRLEDLFNPIDDFNFNYMGISSRTEELTSRVESSRIKAVLKELELPFEEKNIVTTDKGFRYLNDVVDFVLATNMISVGIDISRLNLMLINGMPKNVAEYIQASSRIGRKTNGLVVSLLDPNRAREKSYFEHFINFHQAFYKSVEPLSITPFTESTIDKMLTTSLVAFVRNKYPNLNKDTDATNFKPVLAEEYRLFIEQRFGVQNREMMTYFERRYQNIVDDWESKAKASNDLKYKRLLKRPSDKNESAIDWTVMQSMREIDTDTFIRIKSNFEWR
ncbi:helicase-like protein [Gelidibacter algens]|uniref:Helicase-like protein n=1 Tax=Gelidibacter algens TaxID=49280 RepID=A0A1A7QQV1_9FLAO|nr:helicase-related protein [Gelidibacter algens]OBX21584.1 helicase [Gelidibacter algens]RAJ21134.1 helicase-like protein [Gelidibacter algens]